MNKRLLKNLKDWTGLSNDFLSIYFWYIIGPSLEESRQFMEKVNMYFFFIFFGLTPMMMVVFILNNAGAFTTYIGILIFTPLIGLISMPIRLAMMRLWGWIMFPLGDVIKKNLSRWYDTLPEESRKKK